MIIIPKAKPVVNITPTTASEDIFTYFSNIKNKTPKTTDINKAPVNGVMPASIATATPSSEACAIPSAKNDIFLRVANDPSIESKGARITPAIKALCINSN